MTNLRNGEFKQYLGDGAYIDFDGYQVWVTTTNGIVTTNEIALEPEVMKNLVEYCNKISELRKEKLKNMICGV